LQNVFEVSDAFSSWFVANILSKMGFDLVRYQTNTNSGGGIRGSWLFGGIQSFLLAQPIPARCRKDCRSDSPAAATKREPNSGGGNRLPRLVCFRTIGV